MLDQPDETDDDASEIVSSLVHELREEPGEGPIVRTVTEKRGIREARWVHFDDPTVQDPAIEMAPADTHALLFMAANRHLRAVGEMDFFAVVDTAERISPPGEYPTPEKITQHFEMWADGLKNKNGLLSVDAMAARFIQTQDRLMMLLNDNLEMQAAAFAYADAWHWLHMELFGEHELAATAEVAGREADAAQRLAAKTTAGLSKGPAVLKENKALRMSIIAVEYKKYADGEKNPKKKTNVKLAAGRILQPVNLNLVNRGLQPITETTLKKRLKTIISSA
jgi:hypothetical protein